METGTGHEKTQKIRREKEERDKILAYVAERFEVRKKMRIAEAHKVLESMIQRFSKPSN
jgi:hypothetical protein